MDRRFVMLGDASDTAVAGAFGTLFKIGGDLGVAVINADANRSVAKTQSATELAIAQAQQRLLESQGQLQAETSATQTAAFLKIALWGLGAVALLAALTLALRRRTS